MRGHPTSTLSSRHQVGKLIFDGITPSASIANNWPPAAAAQLPANGIHTKLNAEILAGVFHLMIWGQRSNLQSIPSDCPNRCAEAHTAPYLLFLALRCVLTLIMGVPLL